MAPSEPALALHGRPAAVVIGASAGAIGALTQLLQPLHKGFTLPILVVVHVPADRPSALAELFAELCALEVKEAEDKEPVRPGVIYFAAADHHLLVEADHRLSLSRDEAVLYSRPSIDVLFASAADAYGTELLGIVLTGANSDGAEGLRAIVAQGGAAWVQDPSTAEATAMPQAALHACPGAGSAAPLAIGEALAHLANPVRS